MWASISLQIIGLHTLAGAQVLRRPSGRDVWVLRWFSGFNRGKGQLWTIAPLFYIIKVNMGSDLAGNYQFSSLHMCSGPWELKRERFLSLFGIFSGKSPKMDVWSPIHQPFSGNRSSRVDVRSGFNLVSLKTPESISSAQAESVWVGRCVKFMFELERIEVLDCSNRAPGWSSLSNVDLNSSDRRP